MATQLVRRISRLARRVRDLGEAGMTTAEYAVGTVAACSQPTLRSGAASE